MRFATLVPITLALALTACPGAPVPRNNDISGSVRLNMAGQSAETPTIMPTSPDVARVGQRSFVPGEVVVRFKPGLQTQSLKALAVNGVGLQAVQDLSLERTRLYRANAGARALSADPNATLDLVRQLEARSDVLWAQPNYVYQALATPNDPYAKVQWHYPKINLPQAWDLETGASNAVTVAVVDTGILGKHPEFQAKLLPGYDFITSPQNSNDGDGRDANAEDSGDNPGGQSSYHGSHVAGTVAAATNNSSGVAGVSWGAKILPVRVLGTQGGTMVDIVDGVLWSAGINVQGVPANPNPAQVINLSLGGGGTCSPLEQAAFNQVNAKGSIVVVAAGNENEDASGFSPSSCSGVITVGATDFANKRARYSNYGPRVDVMAPGGDTKVDLNNDNFPDGVLSLSRNDANGEYAFKFSNGTSMAAPHVAGVVALLKSRDPSLNSARALDVLKRTARPLTASDCTGQGPTLGAQDCGAGLMDAAAALQAVGGGQDPNPNPGPNPTPQPDFSLGLNPSSLTVTPNSSHSVALSITRAGGFNGDIGFKTQGAPAGLNFSLRNANSSGGTLEVEVGNVAKGSYAITLVGTAGSLTRNASLSLRVETGAPTRPNIQSTAVLACYYIGNDCDVVKSQVVVIGNPGTSGAFRLRGLEDGKYLLIAWKDVNGDEDVNSGDYLGVYTENADLALVRPPASNVNLEVSPIYSTDAMASAGQQNALRLAKRWWSAPPAVQGQHR